MKDFCLAKKESPLLLAAFVLFLTLSALESYSQNKSNVLTLKECVEIAKRNGPSAEIARSVFENSINSYEAYEAGFYPQASLSGRAPGLVREINAITQPDGSDVFRPQSQLFSSGDITISQKIPTTGAELFVSSGVSRIDVLEGSEYYLWKTNPLHISLRQPIFQFNSMAYDREIWDSRAELYRRQYVEALEQVSLETVNKFFDVYIAKMNLKNAKLNLSINDTLYKLSKGRYKVGTIAENDLLQSELEYANAENNMKEAELSYSQALEELKIALGVDLNKNIEIAVPKPAPKISIPMDEAVKKAKKNGSKILNRDISLMEAEKSLKSSKSRNSFNADIVASYGINQSAGNFNSLYKDLLDQERFNVTFSVPIYQFGKGSAEIEAALAERTQAKSQCEREQKELEIDVKYEILRYKRLKKKAEIAARSDTIAARRFEVAKNRYIIGKIDMTSLFIAQREKDAASINYSQTLRELWTSYYNIRKKTLYDFVNNKKVDVK